MDVVLDEFIASLQQLSSKDDYRGSTISNLSVLNLRQLTEHFGGGMSDFKLFQNSGAIIGNGNITDVIHQHFV